MAACPYTPADLDRLLALDADLVRCPFPLYDVLRTDAPVTFSDKLGGYVVTRYADVIEVLRDSATYSSTMSSGPTSVTGLAQRILDDPTQPDRLRAQAARRVRMAASPVLILADPPQHKRQRTLVAAAFSPKRVKQLEPEVRHIAEGLIAGFVDDGEVELVGQFAFPLPMTVIATLLGVPSARMGDFKRWTNAFVGGFGSLDSSAEEVAEIFDAIDAFYDYFTDQIERRRTRPEDDLLTALVAARMDGATPLSVDEILLMLAQFLVGGHETTTNLITSLMWRLATDPALADRVRANPALIPPLVEEMLRLDAPVQGMFRVTTSETRLGDVPLPEGSLLWLAYGSANRDPAAFAEPDGLVLDAERAAHLAFGRFEHFCLGASVARLELRLATELLLDRLGEISLGCDPDDLGRHPSFVLHGYSRLPLRFIPRT